MSIEPRPLSLARPTADPGEPALIELIRAEINQNGPITFARFMERALYEPGLGYYATSADRPTLKGDFLTSVEIHPIFGWAVARQIIEMWERLGKPGDFVLREYGAGSGTLGRAIKDGLERGTSPLAKALRYEPIEIEGRLQAVEISAEALLGCVIGNEFLDALPVHRLVQEAGRVRELYVDCAGDRFVEVAGDLSDSRLAERFDGGHILHEGWRAEVNLGMAEWLSAVAQQLDRGFVLLIDYGLSRAQLRSEARSTGTVRAFRGQHVSSDILGGVGHQDLTAHIDLDALAEDARAAGLDVLGVTKQAEFLLGCGIDEIYRSAIGDAGEDWEPALKLRSAVRRLLDPHHFGAYAVAILGKGVASEPPLRGLGFRPRVAT